MKNNNFDKLFESDSYDSMNALVLIFDMEDFTTFVNQPDANSYIPKFLNHIFGCLSIIIDGGNPYWCTKTKKQYKPFLKPEHFKFLGDGALYIWDKDKIISSGKNILDLINKLWTLKHNFHVVREKCFNDVSIGSIPKNIRFGLTSGKVTKLRNSKTEKIEYAGSCINLANRLQNYCKEIGFIISAKVDIPHDEITDWSYTKAIALNIKGFRQELIIADWKEIVSLPPEIIDNKFRVIV